jgi:gluconolactonase
LLDKVPLHPKTNFMRTVSVLALLLAYSSVPAQTPATLGRIERLAPALDDSVSSDATIEVLAGGFTWTEGPVWVDDESGGYLLFSDIPRNSIFRWSEARGIDLFMRPSGYTGVSYYGLEPNAIYF